MFSCCNIPLIVRVNFRRGKFLGLGETQSPELVDWKESRAQGYWSSIYRACMTCDAECTYKGAVKTVEGVMKIDPNEYETIYIGTGWKGCLGQKHLFFL